ncbi:hypothetical protein R3P38DRAFT_2826500 [Favolaschia claudopus]|uniref:Uncharacterized protein n=1 Tax=Favolaschia claudopus TaxID=2862362 RepID=A0AAW0EJV8_9AGAR
MIGRALFYLCALSLVSNTYAAQCVNGVCDSFDDTRKAAMSTVVIAGIVVAVVLVLSIGATIFADIVENARANAAVVNMQPYSSPGYPLPSENAALQPGHNQFTSSGFNGGIGASSGSTGMTR